MIEKEKERLRKEYEALRLVTSCSLKNHGFKDNNQNNSLFNAATLMVIIISVFISITLTNFIWGPPFKTASIKNSQGGIILEISYR